MDIPLDQILIQTVNGIVTGMILALVASGLTLIFGIMDVVNFAHGELFMLGAYHRRHDAGGDRQLLAGAGRRGAGRSRCSARSAGHDAAAADRARPARRRSWPPSACRSCCRTTRCGSSARWRARSRSRSPASSSSSTSSIPGTACVIAGAVGRHHRRPLALPEVRHLRHLDPRHDPGPRDGAGDGHSGALVHTGVFAIGAGMAAASGVLFGPAGRRQPRPWASTGCCSAFIVVVVGGMGNLGGSILAAIFISLLEAYASIWVSPGAGGHRLLRGADPDPAVPADRPVRPDTEMSPSLPSRRRLLDRASPSCIVAADRRRRWCCRSSGAASSPRS